MGGSSSVLELLETIGNFDGEPVLDNLVRGEDPVVKDELFHTKPLTLVQKDPSGCEPRHSCHYPCCPVLDDL